MKFPFRITTYGNGPINILVTSGIHPDERNMSIDPALAYLATKYGDRMPLTSHVELCNPSWLRTTYGTNLNRHFSQGSIQHAACVGMIQAINTCANGKPYDLALDLHGDYGTDDGESPTRLSPRYEYLFWLTPRVADWP